MKKNVSGGVYDTPGNKFFLSPTLLSFDGKIPPPIILKVGVKFCQENRELPRNKATTIFQF